MAVKTSQLQIRVTEEQKAALKRLAGAARMTVSRYVLAQTLPSQHQQLDRILASVGRGTDQDAAFAELAALIAETNAHDFTEVLGSPSLGSLGPVAQNQVAAMVEQAANNRSIPPPGWADQVPGLGRPHFAWTLSSLRPHQIRVTPVAFKRRGIFFDPPSRPVFSSPRNRGPAPAPNRENSLRRLELLDGALRKAELKVEFYFLGGAILCQAFQARPRTARIAEMFRPAAAVADVQAALAQREGWPDRWVQQAVREHFGNTPSDRGYLELGNLSAFVPPLEYVLALSVARMRLGTEEGAQDFRYVLRALELTTPEEALEVTGRYFTARQLPADIRATLETLLAG